MSYSRTPRQSSADLPELPVPHATGPGCDPCRQHCSVLVAGTGGPSGGKFILYPHSIPGSVPGEARLSSRETRLSPREARFSSREARFSSREARLRLARRRWCLGYVLCGLQEEEFNSSESQCKS